MRQCLLLLLIVLAVLAGVPAHAGPFIRQSHRIDSLRGLVVDINYDYRNITIQEEFSGLTRRFYVPFKPIDHVESGDEVRVYFRPGTREAVSVKKMTPIEYKKEGQNKGYLLRRESAE